MDAFSSAIEQARFIMNKFLKTYEKRVFELFLKDKSRLSFPTTQLEYYLNSYFDTMNSQRCAGVFSYQVYCSATMTDQD